MNRPIEFRGEMKFKPKKIVTKAATIIIRFEKTQLQKLDCIVKKTGINRSEIVRQMIDKCLSDMEEK